MTHSDTMKLQREFKRMLSNLFDSIYYCANCGNYTTAAPFGLCGSCDSKAIRITKLSDLLKVNAARYRKPMKGKP